LTAEIISFADRRSAAEGSNMNPTPDDFIDQEIAFLQMLRTELRELAPRTAAQLSAVEKAHIADLQRAMTARGFTLTAPKNPSVLAAEVTGLYRHAIGHIVYLAAAAQAEAPAPGAA